MSDLPAEYHFHELNKLFGDYKPRAEMPCFHCDEPEAMDIRFAFAKFAAAVHPRLPRGTMPMVDALFAPEPEPEVETTSEPELETGPRLLSDDNLFMLRDFVLSGEKLVAAAIKAAGGLRALARKLGIRREVIEQWKRIPVERLQTVAKVTGLPQHVLRPDLFDVSAPQFYCTEEEADEIWKWSHARQLWLPLPYPPGFLPAHCCARRVQLKLVTEVALPNV
jgi:hypothetical protein